MDNISFAAGRAPEPSHLSSAFSISPPRDTPRQIPRVATADHGSRDPHSGPPTQQPEGRGLYHSMLPSAYSPSYTYRQSDMGSSQQQHQQIHANGVSPYLMPQPHAPQHHQFPYPPPISPSSRPGWTGPKLKSNAPNPSSASSASTSMKPPPSHFSSFSANPDSGPSQGHRPSTASPGPETNDSRRSSVGSAPPAPPPPHSGPGGEMITFPAFRPSAGGPVLSNMHRPGGPMTLVGPGGMPFSNAMSGGALAHPGAVAHHSPVMPPMAPGHGHGHGHGHPNMHMPGFGMRAMTAAAADAMTRPFRCEHCPQSFNRRHDMRRHERIHLTIKPFPCKTCEKTFSRKDALKVCMLLGPSSGLTTRWN